MLGHTKKHPIEFLHVICPKDAYADVLKMLESYNCEVERSIPAEELFDNSPGTMLQGARYREDMTQEQLAKATGIPRRHISEMENNKRPIGKQNARKLADVLNVAPRRFLSV